MQCASRASPALATSNWSNELVTNRSGDALVNHQANFNPTILSAPGCGLVLRHWLQLPVTKWLDQTIQRHLVLVHDVINDRVRASFAQIDVALRVAGRICVADYGHHPAFGVLRFHPCGSFVDGGLGLWTQRRTVGDELDSDGFERVEIIQP